MFTLKAKNDSLKNSDIAFAVFVFGEKTDKLNVENSFNNFIWIDKLKKIFTWIVKHETFFWIFSKN